jgi:hypothetical protein
MSDWRAIVGLLNPRPIFLPTQNVTRADEASATARAAMSRYSGTSGDEHLDQIAFIRIQSAADHV